MFRDLQIQIEIISRSHQNIPTFEINDSIREEDKETYFFRKTKLIPNNQLHKKKLFNLSEENIQPGIASDNEIEVYCYDSPNSKERVSFKSFEIIRLVGIGSFGKIFLVRKRDDGKLFAMKVLKKRNLVVKKHLRYALTEMNILKSCDHPFIIKIYYSFQVFFFFGKFLKNQIFFISRHRKIFISLSTIAIGEILPTNWQKFINFRWKSPGFISRN